MSESSIEDVVGRITSALDYPMLVVTARADGEQAGCLVGFATQCSIEPVRVMVWISKANRTLRVAQRAPVLAIHFLASDNRGLAELFGAKTGDDVDKFSRCRWHEGPAGAPILDDCARWLVGDVVRRDDTGDHVGFLVQPNSGFAGEWPAQLSFQMVRDLTPGHPA